MYFYTNMLSMQLNANNRCAELFIAVFHCVKSCRLIDRFFAVCSIYRWRHSVITFNITYKKLTFLCKQNSLIIYHQISPNDFTVLKLKLVELLLQTNYVIINKNYSIILFALQLFKTTEKNPL